MRPSRVDIRYPRLPLHKHTPANRLLFGFLPDLSRKVNSWSDPHTGNRLEIVRAKLHPRCGVNLTRCHPNLRVCHEAAKLPSTWHAHTQPRVQQGRGDRMEMNDYSNPPLCAGDKGQYSIL